VLEALASRAEHFERPLRARATSPAVFAEDLFSTMNGLLHPLKAAAERADRVHVLIIITDTQQDEDPDVRHAVCSAVLAARKKFQSRMGRAILAVRGRFHAAGPNSNGGVRPLPRRDAVRGTGVDAFDLVVLLDTQKTDGSDSPAAEAATHSHAAVLANLMLSDFEESIHRLLEHQRGPLGSDGLFASFGVAELPFSSQETLQSFEAVLWRGMARQVLRDATAPPPLEVFYGDSWKEEVEERLAAEPFESADAFWIDKFHRQAAEKLQRCFEKSAYHPGVLLRLLAQREEHLIRFRDGARARLTSFMDEFVPRNVLPVSPRQKPEPMMRSHREYGWTRIATLRLCLAGFLAVLVGSLILGSTTLRFPALLVLAFLTGGVISLLLMRRSGAKTVEAPQPAPTAPQRDVIAELRRHRACGEIASGILKRHRKLGKSIDTDIDALRAELNRSSAAKPPGALALPEGLIEELLTANGLDAQQVLLEFWEQADEQLAARPASREKPLPQRLRRYAASRCAVFSNLRMNDVLGYLGGPAALENPRVSREIDRLQTGSSPWMPVGGLAAGIVVALPETLNPELRHSIAERFQGPVFVVSTKRESIAALQWTQGYAEASGTNTRAMAL
jgi:hypothetical protein